MPQSTRRTAADREEPSSGIGYKLGRERREING
jgi:hypothetical protein